MTPKKSCVSVFLVVILLITPLEIWSHLPCHFSPKNWISCAGPFTVLCFVAETAFKIIWIILLFLNPYFCCVASQNDVTNVLQVSGTYTLFQGSLYQSTTNGSSMFPPLGQSSPSVLDIPPCETNCVLYQGVSVVIFSEFSDLFINSWCLSSSLSPGCGCMMSVHLVKISHMNCVHQISPWSLDVRSL